MAQNCPPLPMLSLASEFPSRELFAAYPMQTLKEYVHVHIPTRDTQKAPHTRTTPVVVQQIHTAAPSGDRPDVQQVPERSRRITRSMTRAMGLTRTHVNDIQREARPHTSVNTRRAPHTMPKTTRESGTRIPSTPALASMASLTHVQVRHHPGQVGLQWTYSRKDGRKGTRTQWGPCTVTSPELAPKVSTKRPTCVPRKRQRDTPPSPRARKTPRTQGYAANSAPHTRGTREYTWRCRGGQCTQRVGWYKSAHRA